VNVSEILDRPQPHKIEDARTAEATPPNAEVHIPEERLWQHSGSEDLSWSPVQFHEQDAGMATSWSTTQ